ncbi:hypothetical protein AAFF_G00335810 [Aldrovandia affinis]|uniref:Tower domain-containing protein n=1 Tax=Aldrovandia affinis TaxID=143900 RepID=A0AAD7SM37_9TELE|nr:hypothetical protein AAFF_G00335810 [Aldrovandia affinis]
MFEAFQCHIAEASLLEELGPLCPDWFEVLTAKSARDDASSDGPEASRKTCVQEGMASTPLGNTAADSQIFSTPKIFKSRMAQSPELLTTDEELFSPDRGGVGGSKLPWVDTSPSLFRSAKDSQTVKPCNTPLPTDYFAKEEDNTRPVSPSGDKCVIFVRELFPSVPNVYEMTELSSEMPDGPFVQPSEVNGQVDCLMDQSNCQGLPSVDESFSDSLWKQTLPDAIQDGEVRSAVASVLDGAEDVLSVFFSNSSSAFRRVKAKGRSRRRQTSSATVAVLTPPSELENGSTEEPAKIARRIEDVKDTFAFQKDDSSETKDRAITQWTPLTLPDISDTNAGIDFCTVSSTSSTTLPSEGLIERQTSTTLPARPKKGDEGHSLGMVVLAALQSRKSVPVQIELSSYKHVPQGVLGQDQAVVHQSAQENGEAPVRPNGSAPTQEHSVLGKVALELEDWEMVQGKAGGATQQSSSLLDMHSLGLSHCSVTQQRYLEQEAMACTRALLEDEDLDERAPPGAPGGLSTPSNIMTVTQSSDAKPSERSKGSGKRLKSEDSDFTDQPPLKRRLLADFDQSDCGKRAVLPPVKSSPNVTLRDRRIFRYNVPLQPNVTKPPGDQRQRKAEPHIVAPDSILQDSKLANPGGVVFMPPFRKCPKPEPQRTGQPPESRRLPSVFVPPFRRAQVSPCSSVGDAPPQPIPSSSEAPVVPTVFAPPFKKKDSSATEPGSDGKASGSFAGVAVTHNTSGDDSGPRSVNANIPGEREAVGERPTLAPASPGEHEADPSDPGQTLQNLRLARDLQDMRIRKKRRQVIRPQPGSLLPKPGLYAYGVQRGVSRISSASAESFRFRCGDFFRGEVLTAGDGLQLADGGWLIPGDGDTVGKEEFYRALCDTPGVDPKLISEGWLYNHYRWVVWKRASMERSFPSVMGSHCLTPEQVLLQLKYRYDVEVDQSRRSALRKIMERDDTPAKTLVLCVCGMATAGSVPVPTPPKPAQSESRTSPGSKAGGSPAGVVWVTDGWYAIKALLDAPLTAMLLKGRLAIGGKVVTHGAELVGSQDACPPLEAPESLMLKISANSTRPARWDTKLGFHRDPRPFRLPLSSLYSGGGLAGCVDMVVLRTYPTQWMEKKAGGVFVFRSDRAEQREARRHSDSKHKAMEVLFAKVQAQFEKDQEVRTRAKSRRRRLSRQEIEALQDGEELDTAVESDPIHLESHLSEQQLATLSNYRQSLGQERQERLQEHFRQALAEAQEAEGGACSNRDVAPLWKLSVCDFSDQRSNVYLLSIWRPSMELQSLLREGRRFKVYQVATSEGKKRASSTAVQLTATKRTHFQHVLVSPECLPELFQPRVSVSFRALQGPGFHAPCGEVDVVGFVLSIADRHGPSPALYLVDERQDFACVRIAAGLAQLALEELVKPLTLLALSNLQLRHQSPALMPALFAGELTLFSTHPKEPHLQVACAHLRSVVQGNKHFFQTAEEKLSGFIPSNVPSSLLSPREAGPSPKMANGQIPPQPVRASGLFTPVSRKPPLPVSTSEDRDPKTLKRKRGLDFLSRIPSPPPLSPLWGNASPSVKSTFNPPRKSETPQPLGREPPPPHGPTPEEAEWVNDEELAMINTQALLDGLGGPA